MKWISVKERLPKKGKYVLGWNGSRTLDGYFTKVRGKDYFKDIVGWTDLCYITHWMERPALPEGK